MTECSEPPGLFLNARALLGGLPLHLQIAWPFWFPNPSTSAQNTSSPWEISHTVCDLCSCGLRLGGEGITGVMEPWWKNKKTTTTFNMHTLWSATGASVDDCHSVEGRGRGARVNKCLEFIWGVLCDSYYTNIHECFFSPPFSCTVWGIQCII